MKSLQEALKIITANVNYAEMRYRAAQALYQGQICEVAKVMAAGVVDADDTEGIQQAWNEVSGLFEGREEKAALAVQYYLALREKTGLTVAPKPQSAPVSIVYLRNRGSDGAYDHFTRESEHVRAMYVSSHEEALDNCYDEYADACILPYSDPERGVHMGFRMLISRYGFKINGMVRVENREGTAMDYVLLRRECDLTDGDAYLSITLPMSSGLDLPPLLETAKHCSLTEASVVRLPDTYAHKECYDLHFYGKKEAIEQYLFYLSLDFPRYELLGIYRKEKENI